MKDVSIKELESQGWVRQFTASGHRLDEAVDNYRTLGFEVKAIPINELYLSGCTVCFDDATDKTVMIFTRKT